MRAGQYFDVACVGGLRAVIDFYSLKLRLNIGVPEKALKLCSLNLFLIANKRIEFIDLTHLPRSC